MQERWERVSSVLLTVAALVIAGVFAFREVASTRGSDRPKPAYDERWRELMNVAIRNGPSAAPIYVAEFSDFECPFCKQFHQSLRALERENPGKIAHVFAHFPSPRHKSARRAAIAAQCASSVGRLAEAIDVLFGYQDSLGTKQWPWFLAKMPTKDSLRVARCMQDSLTRSEIDASVALGQRMGVIGTPTIFLNGWRYPGAPQDSEFTRAVRDLLAGKKPYRAFPKEAIDVRFSSPPRK